MSRDDIRSIRIAFPSLVGDIRDVSHDTIIGGDGNDSITLGAGNDVLAFAGAAAVGTAATVAELTASIGSDTITDYSVADDGIALSQATFGTDIGAIAATLAANQFSTIASDAAASIDFTAVDNGLVYVQDVDQLYYSTIDLSTAGDVAVAIAAGTIALIGQFNDVLLVDSEFTIIA